MVPLVFLDVADCCGSFADFLRDFCGILRICCGLFADWLRIIFRIFAEFCGILRTTTKGTRAKGHQCEALRSPRSAPRFGSARRALLQLRCSTPRDARLSKPERLWSPASIFRHGTAWSRKANAKGNAAAVLDFEGRTQCACKRRAHAVRSGARLRLGVCRAMPQRNAA